MEQNLPKASLDSNCHEFSYLTQWEKSTNHIDEIRKTLIEGKHLTDSKNPAYCYLPQRCLNICLFFESVTLSEGKMQYIYTTVH